MNIVGIVVSFLPEKQAIIAQAITALGGEVHAADRNGKMVVTLEHEDNSVISATMIEFQNIEGVLTVAMVYHEAES